MAFHFGGVAPGTADTADAGVLHRVLEFSLLSPMGSSYSLVRDYKPYGGGAVSSCSLLHIGEDSC